MGDVYTLLCLRSAVWLKEPMLFQNICSDAFRVQDCIGPRSAVCGQLFGLRNLCYSKISVVMLLGYRIVPGRVAQSVTCLATDASLTADPGVASSIPARDHTFVEIDHEIISTVMK